MSFHRNAKLGLAGRHALVSAVAGGMTLKAAAAAFSVSPATAHRWWRRWLEASEEAQATLACLFDRSSRPHRSPRQLAPEFEQTICDCRRKTGWGPRLVAGATGFAHSMVSKLLPATDSHAAGRPRRSRPTATSGPVRVICCTWTPASTSASSGQATALPATAQARTASAATASTSSMRSSTTTHGSPTPRSIQTNAQPPSLPSSSARSPSTPRTESQRSG